MVYFKTSLCDFAGRLIYFFQIERIIMFRYNLPEKYQVLDGSVLKLIACITMLIDHAAVCLIYHMILLPNAPIHTGTDLYRLYIFYKVLRAVGRCAFPIFSFLLVEGFFYTRSRGKYACRLAVFGILSEVPFDLCIKTKPWDPSYNNVYFTLFLGICLLWAWESFRDRWYLQLPVCGLLVFLAEYFHTDYGWKGLLLIFILYLMRAWRVPQVVFGLVSMYWELPGVILGFIPILFYSGKRGRQFKYLYYAFYPAHLLLLYLLSVYLVNRI
ncbi:MAG TPA: conjugal transfer protein TraX [Lachnospiraceae bacterium]|nr:conjugal transfer protein TraX [Lachnospiraceae bacterium]